MIQTKLDLAIILKQRLYNERDQWVKAITQEHGLMVAIAKNSIHSKRFGSSLDLFTASHWTFQLRPHRNLALLTHAQLSEPFTQLRYQWERFALASVISEWIEKMAPRQIPCPELFRLHANALHFLEQSFLLKDQKIAFLNTFLGKLLQWNGSQPKLLYCSKCYLSLAQTPADTVIYGHPLSAGWYCVSCRPDEPHPLLTQFPLSVGALKDLQKSLKQSIRKTPQTWEASPQEHQKLFQFLEALFIFHLPGFERYPMKSLPALGLRSNELLLKENGQRSVPEFFAAQRNPSGLVLEWAE